MRQRVPEGPTNERIARSSYVLLVVVALSVIFSPAVYKGGAEHAHAHGFFEFWGADAGRAFDHHRHTHTHATSHSSVALSSAPIPTLPPSVASVVAEFASAVSDDLPTVSPAVTPGGVTGALAISLGVLTLLLNMQSQRIRYPGLRVVITGRAVSPEPPPPRLAPHLI